MSTPPSPAPSATPLLFFAWSEEPGRPLEFGTEALLERLGLTDDPRATWLDSLLDADGRAALDAASGASLESDGAPVDLGTLEFRVAEGSPHRLRLTVVHEPALDRYLATAVEVDAQLATEAALAEKSTRLELVLEGTRLGMWDWNPQTGEVAFNERWAEMLGHTLEEIPFTLEAWESRVHPDDLASCYADITAHLEGRTNFYENVHRMRHANGEWVHILDRGRVMEWDAEGKPTRFTGTHTNITAQKLAELEAREASRAKSLFLATMSHEIRTPLNGILGLLQVVEGTELNEQQSELLTLIGQSGEHLLVLINDILDLSKIDAGKLELDSQPTDVGEVLESIAGLFEHHASEKGIDLHCRLALPEDRWFRTDSHRLRQIVANLVSNAIKFTSKGEVLLTARTESDGETEELIVTVSDTGRGIGDLESIWEGFRQEDATISRSHGGTGLGLTICRSLAELLGGQIRVESELGAGSSFELRLPVLACPAERAPFTPSTDVLDDALTSLKVLVAEDNRVNQKVAEGMFLRLGLDVVLVNDGLEAVERCAAELFDLVLMDLHMPQLDGLQAARALIEAHGDDCPRIVALSADVSPESAAQCRDVGMDGFLSKPFRLGELEAVLRATRAH